MHKHVTTTAWHLRTLATQRTQASSRNDAQTGQAAGHLITSLRVSEAHLTNSPYHSCAIFYLEMNQLRHHARKLQARRHSAQTYAGQRGLSLEARAPNSTPANQLSKIIVKHHITINLKAKNSCPLAWVRASRRLALHWARRLNSCCKWGTPFHVRDNSITSYSNMYGYQTQNGPS
jgi:hypothetical protein